MRRLINSVLIISIVAVLLVAGVGCSTLTPTEGIDALKQAYANTRDNYNDIYQYNEKIYNKATYESKGSIKNEVVNINCAVDKDYNILKDKDYAINIYEDMYIETMDQSAKINNKFVASNSVTVGETRVNGDKSNAKVDGLFVNAKTLAIRENDNKEQWLEVNKCQQDVNAKIFYGTEYFRDKQLMNKQIMQEIGLLESKYMNFDIDKGGIVKKGRTVDYTFKVTAEYLEYYKNTHDGNSSLFDGKYVWIQTSHNRIANVYVYKEEVLGAGLTAEYESYLFMITYLGKRIDMPKLPSATESAPQYVKETIFENGLFKEGVLSGLNIIKK